MEFRSFGLWGPRNSIDTPVAIPIVQWSEKTFFLVYFPLFQVIGNPMSTTHYLAASDPALSYPFEGFINVGVEALGGM